jgi:hypothetical protein
MNKEPKFDDFIFNDDNKTMNKTYTQCLLKKNGNMKVAWIPSEFARIGNIIKIKITQAWSDGWKVLNVYSSQTKEKTEAGEKDYRQFEDVLKGS